MLAATRSGGRRAAAGGQPALQKGSLPFSHAHRSTVAPCPANCSSSSCISSWRAGEGGRGGDTSAEQWDTSVEHSSTSLPSLPQLSSRSVAAFGTPSREPLNTPEEQQQQHAPFSAAPSPTCTLEAHLRACVEAALLAHIHQQGAWVHHLQDILCKRQQSKRCEGPGQSAPCMGRRRRLMQRARSPNTVLAAATDSMCTQAGAHRCTPAASWGQPVPRNAPFRINLAQ